MKDNKNKIKQEQKQIIQLRRSRRQKQKRIEKLMTLEKEIKEKIGKWVEQNENKKYFVYKKVPMQRKYYYDIDFDMRFTDITLYTDKKLDYNPEKEKIVVLRDDIDISHGYKRFQQLSEKPKYFLYKITMSEFNQQDEYEWKPVKIEGVKFYGTFYPVSMGDLGEILFSKLELKDSELKKLIRQKEKVENKIVELRKLAKFDWEIEEKLFKKVLEQQQGTENINGDSFSIPYR